MPETTEKTYFELTVELNATDRIAILASGQAALWHRLVMTSQGGAWIVRETNAACERIREVLAGRGARFRLGAPFDPRWLGGGWSSHFEFFDDRGRGVRCDFFGRPPRIRARRARRAGTHRAAPDRLWARGGDRLAGRGRDRGATTTSRWASPR